jgi:hypothetical protein
MDVFATVSYGAAALAFLVLAALSTVSWRGHATGMLFILASAATAAWATALAVHAWTEGVSLLLLYASEAVRNIAWLLLLASIARPVAPSLVIILARLVVPAILVLAPFLPMLLAFTPGADFPDLLVSRAGLLAVLFGLILLEQIFRNSNQAARSALRYLAIGLGGMFAYDFFLYSQAELLRGIDVAVWSLRGLLTAASAPLIALALRRNPQWSVDIFVSRQIVFHSATFLVVGVYLLLMGLGGYYVRAIGGTWSVHHRRDPEQRRLGCQHRQDGHDDPADQRDRQRSPVSDAVLPVAEREGADGRGDVDQKDQQHRLGLLEAEHLLGIHRRQCNDPRDACLVSHRAG